MSFKNYEIVYVPMFGRFGIIKGSKLIIGSYKNKRTRFYAVQFKDQIENGHNCDGLTELGKGIWLTKDKLIRQELVDALANTFNLNLDDTYNALNKLELHENDLIKVYDNILVCNDECEIFRDTETGDFIIHTDEDREYTGSELQDVWKYNEETQEYKHIYHKGDN